MYENAEVALLKANAFREEGSSLMQCRRRVLDKF